jgi:TolB-like protein
MSELSKALFLSYASEDAAAARQICSALRSAGVEVWFDQSELRGGDDWDQKIRRQVRSCTLFLALVSANTRVRTEGYFRLEWKLAVDRSHLMALERTFLIPVAIDASSAGDSTVPERFREVQWAQLPGGRPSPEFVAHIKRLLDVAATPSTVPQVGEPQDQRETHRDARRTTRDRKIVRWALLSIGLLIAVGLMTVLVRRYDRSAGETSTQAAAPGTATTAKTAIASAPPVSAGTAPVSLRPRIAVLPFENLSSDPNNAFFTNGVHEEILTELANHAAGLDVISSTTMSTYRGKPVAVQTLAHDLNCTYVLEGSMQREGNEVRLTLQLIDARNDTHVWARDYDRKLVSAMALEREVAAAVAEQLTLKFAGSAQGPALTSDPQAYDLYLKARALESNSLTAGSESGLEQARQLLDQSIGADPKFVRAYLERMSLRLQLFRSNFSRPDEVLPLARADLASAQRLAPADPVVTEYTGVMAYATQDYERALRLFEQAQSAGVADPELLNWKNTLLFAMGRYREATAISARLADLDPKNQSAQDWWIYMLMELHQYQEALHLIDALSARDLGADFYDYERKKVLAYAGGQFGPWHARINRRSNFTGWHTAQEMQSNFAPARAYLAQQHRYRELVALIDTAPADDWRCDYYMWPLYRVGRMPVFESRGWQDMFLGNAAEARRDGARIDAYLNRTPETQWNRWFRDLLRADAQLFMGNGAEANRFAAEAVALTRAKPDVSDQMNAYVWSTEIMAWTDRKDEAAQRLTDLSTSVPGYWPGEIVVDPKYTLPLTGNPAYAALSSGLKEQMAALKLQ